MLETFTKLEPEQLTENFEGELLEFMRQLVHPGRESNGSYTVGVLFRITPNDEITLRAHYLKTRQDQAGLISRMARCQDGTGLQNF